MRLRTLLMTSLLLIPTTALGQEPVPTVPAPSTATPCDSAIALPGIAGQPGGAALSGEVGSVSSSVPIPNACDAPPSPVAELAVLSARNMGEPLYVIDGVRASAADFNRLSPELIESISILRDEQAAHQYGADGKNGVVVVRTRSSEAKPDDLEP